MLQYHFDGRFQGSLPSINSGLHSLAEFFTGLRTLRAEQDGSGCSCKLVAGVYDDALADIGVAEGTCISCIISEGMRISKNAVENAVENAACCPLNADLRKPPMTLCNEDSESPDELNALFALRDFLRENLKTSEVKKACRSTNLHIFLNGCCI